MPSRLQRLVSIDAHIRSSNFPSVEKLCHLFEVQPRTIYQDLRELREMFGMDIRFDRLKNGYYNATPSKKLPPLAITYEEALLITLAIEMLASSMGASVRGALTRTIDMLLDNDDLKFEWMSKVISLQHSSGCEVRCSIMIDVLGAAARRQPTLLISAESEAVQLTLIPQRIERNDDGHWYLIGTKCNDDSAIAHRLCDVSEVRVLASGEDESG